MNQELQENLEKYFSKQKLVKFKKGEIILKPGDKPNFVGYLKTGYVRMYTINENGNEVTVSFFKPILYLTTIFALTGLENKYFFEAITKVEMYTAPIEETNKFFEENRQVSISLMKNISELFLESIDHYNFLLSGNAYNRVAKMVTDLNHKKEPEANKKEYIGVTHKLIASLTGLTRETVTIQMLRLEKEGIIENRNKKVFILDWNKLKAATKNK